MNTCGKFMLCIAVTLGSACLTFPSGSSFDGGADGPAVVSDASLTDGSQTDANCADSDGDGYLPAGCGSALPADCAPEDPNENPGSREICGDATDQNCDTLQLSCADSVTPHTIDSSSGYEVTNGNVLVHFDPLNGWLISELRLRAPLSTNNLLRSTGTMREMYVGLNMWEVAFQHTPDSAPMVTILAEGEAVFRIRIQSVAGDLQLDSHYTVFPDGRIHKDDEVSIQAFNSGIWLTSYIALEPDEFTHVTCTYGGSQVPIGTPTSHCSPSAALTGSSCAYSSTTSTMVGFIHSVPSTPTPDGPRVQEVQTSPSDDHNLSLMFDWASSEDISMGDRRGNFVVYPGEAGATANECAEVEAMRGWLFTQAQLDLLGGATLHTSGSGNSDDDGNGYYEGGGFWAIDAGNANEVSWTINTLSMSRQAPQRGAFRLHGLALARGGGGSYLPFVEVNGEAQVNGQHYLWQTSTDPDNGAQQVGWLYFNRPLPHDATVRVRVPNGSI